MSEKKGDRHKDHSRQYNVRVPNELLDAFSAACQAQKVQPATMVRTLMQGFVDVAKEAEKAAAKEVVV